MTPEKRTWRPAQPSTVPIPIDPTTDRIPRRLLARREHASGATIGRHRGSDIFVDDPLVSHVHARLLMTPDGPEIVDNISINGTFVNGRHVARAQLHDGDIVTVGNTDLLASGGTLVPAPEAPSSGGIEVYRLGRTVDGHRLLSDVSFAARPGTVTAVIGPSGAGKSTLITLLGGAAEPDLGRVTFDGRDIHAE